MVAVLQGGHQGLIVDGTELVGEGAVEHEDVHREDPLAYSGGMLEDEALVDEEDTTLG